MRSTCFAVAAVAFLLSANAHAQGGPGTGGGAGPQGRMYDPKTVVTVAGEVLAVESAAGIGARRGGMHLVLRSDAGETVSVRLGPPSYVEQHAMTIRAGDRIEVKGSRVTIDGKPAIVAAEVTKGREKLLLRDDAGVPYWSGAGRRRGPPAAD